MLAALGGVSSAYHLHKMLAWRSYEQSRILEAERLLRDYKFKHPDQGPAAMRMEAPGLLPAEPPRQPRGGGWRGGPPPAAAHAPPPGAGHPSRPPHLDRASPVPPGGF